jgi:hypothetical protein
MSDDAEFRVLFETALEIDQERLSEARRGGGRIVADQDLPLLQRQNRVALAVGEVQPKGQVPGDAKLICYEVPLRCVLHPAAGCHFREAKLVVDLTATTGARVRDMAPRDVRGDHPVEITTTVSAGLSFEIIPAVVPGVELKRDRSVSRKVYQPEILASGRGFERAVWTFRSIPGEYLHSEREVRLLASTPAGGGLHARFNLRAQVALDGVRAVVPLFRKRAEVDQTYDLLGP